MSNIVIGDIVDGCTKDNRIVNGKVNGKVLCIDKNDSELTYFIETLNNNYYWLITDTVRKIY